MNREDARKVGTQVLLVGRPPKVNLAAHLLKLPSMYDNLQPQLPYI